MYRVIRQRQPHTNEELIITIIIDYLKEQGHQVERSDKWDNNILIHKDEHHLTIELQSTKPDIYAWWWSWDKGSEAADDHHLNANDPNLLNNITDILRKGPTYHV